MAGDVISSWDKLLAYCRMTMAHQKIEQFRLLFLDKRNRLIADEVQQQGTSDHTPVYTREVVKRALELGAASLILVLQPGPFDGGTDPADRIASLSRFIPITFAQSLPLVMPRNLVDAAVAAGSFHD